MLYLIFSFRVQNFFYMFNTKFLSVYLYILHELFGRDNVRIWRVFGELTTDDSQVISDPIISNWKISLNYFDVYFSEDLSIQYYPR